MHYYKFKCQVTPYEGYYVVVACKGDVGEAVAMLNQRYPDYRADAYEEVQMDLVSAMMYVVNPIQVVGDF